MKFLDKGLISLDYEAQDAADAIRKAGQLLVDSGAAKSRYIDAMLNSYEDKGPYFVLAPHIALPHAKPEDGVNEASVSMLRLKHPIAFGHQKNDPVHLVFALGASSSSEHIALLRRLTTLLSNPSQVEQLRSAATEQDVHDLLAQTQN
ncbi:PTS sugar transporter subunit IIA [Paenibacillus senegalensis]|uniref:PTS sugar transporter subunit IIA n=1 Tax=Paenibacillus senegalensis TaxID=1465766 RepID=UPI000288603B|nr:PTS sugar transporter subunit IIA [Paenibacillus senegalensis]